MADNIRKLLEPFLNQAKTNNLKTKHFLNKFENLKVKVSFGQGALARIPWISFLAEGQSTANGIYPVYLLYKEDNLLILAYGISETNTPEINWKFEKKPFKIKDYFKEKGLTPERYGDSFIYSVYELEKGINWSKIQDDIQDIIKQYISMNLESVEISPSINKEFKNKAFKDNLNISGLQFNDILIYRFISSLLTKPFVILTGLSGSGKTKLAQAFALWICQSNRQFKIVPVGADWTNREPLLGYPNSLESNNYVKPDNGVLDLLLDASQEENKNKPHFLILDEMNLSHVERYFADFLSVMESGNAIKLYSGTSRQSSDGKAIPQEISWPKNLFIIGTVNIDETTYMFSPKVLDRANVLEFRITEDELSDYLASAGELNLEELAGKGAGMGSDFARLALERNYPLENAAKLNDALLEFFKELKKIGAEFGYRTASEIKRFVGIAKKLDPDWDVDQIIDAAIMQKLLPKLHGSRSKLNPVLTSLAKLCIDGIVSEDEVKKKLFEVYDTDGFALGLTVKYKVSLEKICRMHKNVIANGFTSYAEA
jgi:5-methylcytosine-specific restriction enzyme B